MSVNALDVGEGVGKNLTESGRLFVNAGKSVKNENSYTLWWFRL